MSIGWSTSAGTPPPARAAPIALAGAGLVTALGGSVRETWSALLAGRHITDHARVCVELGASRSRISQIAWIAACEAAAEADWSSAELSDERSALVVATSKGPIDAWLESNSEPTATPVFPTDALSGWGLAELAKDLAGALGITGPRLTICAACASGLYALVRGVLLLRERSIDRVLVVAAESSLHPLFRGSFDRMGVLAPPGGHCRPMDLQRDGFHISEAAAAVCLSRLSGSSAGADETGDDWLSIPNSTAPQPVWIDRMAMGAEGTHLTGGAGYSAALRELLARAIDGRNVDLIHSHATATVANDAIELDAIDASVIPGAAAPLVYSHKAALGHSLGAAGLVSVVINRQIHREGIVPPNPLTQQPLPAANVRIRRVPTPLPAPGAALRRSIALAAGFGGSMAAIGLASRG